MTDCGIPLPCESAVVAASDALTITNGGTGSAIRATSTGVAVTADSTDGIGVLGQSTTQNGILAISDNGSALRAISNSGHAISALSAGTSGIAPPACTVFGESNTAYGVVGSSATGVGVMGRSDSERGVLGMSASEVGVMGTSVGLGPVAVGVVGTCEPGTGVFGSSNSNSGVTGFCDIGVGVKGIVDKSGTAVQGSSASGIGVSGQSQGGLLSAGVQGTSDDGFISVGVMGISNGFRGVGVYGRGGTDPQGGANGGPAGLFDGDVHVFGSLIKSGGGFMIDHPLDPAHMHLHHSFVESSERKNVYDGIAKLDNNGTCTVELPDWFDAINGDYRYQLTSIGEPSPELHVADEVSNNGFSIAGGSPGAKVSWQVTGTRRDAWAQANPLVVAEAKTQDDTGFYVHPELSGQPRENSTLWRGNSEALRQLEESGAHLSGPDADRIRQQVRALRERSAGGYRE